MAKSWLFIHSPIVGCLGFQFGVIINKAAMNILVKKKKEHKFSNFLGMSENWYKLIRKQQGNNDHYLKYKYTSM